MSCKEMYSQYVILIFLFTYVLCRPSADLIIIVPSEFSPFLKDGEPCQRDLDCDFGSICRTISENRQICSRVTTNLLSYNKHCSVSNQCDITKALCCKRQRRHRQLPRNVCSYFNDPSHCIGAVDTDKIIDDVKMTEGEKYIY